MWLRGEKKLDEEKDEGNREHTRKHPIPKKHARTQKLKTLARDQIYEAFLAHCSGILKECRGDLSRRDSFFYA